MATIIKSNMSSVEVVNGYFKLPKSPNAALNTAIDTRIPNVECIISGGVIIVSDVESDRKTGEGLFKIKWTSEDGYVLYKPSTTVVTTMLVSALLWNTRIPLASGCRFANPVVNGLSSVEGYELREKLYFTGNFTGGSLIIGDTATSALYPFGDIMLDWDIFPTGTKLYRCYFYGGICFNWEKFFERIIPYGEGSTRNNDYIRPVGRFVVPNDHVFVTGYTWAWDLNLCKTDPQSVDNLIKSIAATNHDDRLVNKYIGGALRYATDDVADEIAALRTRGWSIT